MILIILHVDKKIFQFFFNTQISSFYIVNIFTYESFADLIDSPLSLRVLFLEKRTCIIKVGNFLSTTTQVLLICTLENPFSVR